MRLALLALAVLLAACNPLKPYRIEIQQGNHITQEQVSQLKPGMTREQVRFVLGTPLLTDMFHADRWDYIFRRQLADSNKLEERRLTVVFVDDRLSSVEGDVMPAVRAEDKDKGAGK